MNVPRNSKPLVALTMTGVSLAMPVISSSQAFAAEAPAATQIANQNLAGSSLKVTGGEGEVQTLTNGRTGVSRQVTLNIPNLDGALKAGQTTEIELLPTLASGSEGKSNPDNLLFRTKMTEVTDASGKVIGTLSCVSISRLSPLTQRRFKLGSMETGAR